MRYGGSTWELGFPVEQHTQRTIILERLRMKTGDFQSLKTLRLSVWHDRARTSDGPRVAPPASVR